MSKSILVLDKDASLAKTLGIAYKRLQYRIDSADSIVRGDELIASNEYDLIFVDFKLKDGSGLDMLEGIRADRKASEIPVIMSTEVHTKHAVEAAIRYGASDYLVKPIALAP